MLEATEPAISGDGKVVAFVTTATLAGDGNVYPDIYARRLVTDETVLVSRSTGLNGDTGQGASGEPTVDAKGDNIAFSSSARLHAQDSNGRLDVYRRTLNPPAGFPYTDLISAREADGYAGDGDSGQPSISADGTAIAFASTAADLDKDTPDEQRGESDVFLSADGTLATLSAELYGGDPSSSGAPDVAGAAGALKVAFETRGNQTATTRQIAVADRAAGSVKIVTKGSSGDAGDRPSGDPSLSGDGKLVAFWTSAGNLGDAIGGDMDDVVVRDLAAGRNELASAPATGPLAEDLGAVLRVPQPGILSPSARYAVFAAGHDGLGVADRETHVVRRDAVSGSTVLVDRADGPGGTPARLSFDPSASADGRIVAFVTDSALDPADGNGREDVYLRDVVAGTTRLVSRTPAGKAGNGESGTPSVSADGRRVAFDSTSTDLRDGDSNGARDVYVLDLATNTMIHASRAAAPAGRKSWGAALSADGSLVAFTSEAVNLDPADTDVASDVFVRDLDAATTQLVSRRSDGSKQALPSESASISADGSRIAFESYAALEGAGVTGQHIYVRDRATAKTVLAESRVRRHRRACRQRLVRARHQRRRPRGGVPDQRHQPGRARRLRLRAAAGRGDHGRGRRRAAGRAVGRWRVRDARDDRSRADRDVARPRPIRAARRQQRLQAAGEPDGPAGHRRRAEPQGGGATSAPVLDRLALTRKRFRVGSATTARVARLHRGTVVRFALDRDAQVTLTFRRRVDGRWVRRGTLRRTGRAGANRVAFSGRIGRKALRPDRYRMVARARDDAGRTSASQQAGFRILRRG